MASKTLSEALADRKYMGIMFRLGGMIEIEDDPTILLDAIRHLESELAFQAKNAADAHSERAYQFRRAADALEENERLRESLARGIEHGRHEFCPVEYDNSCCPDESKCTCWMKDAKALIARPEEHQN